jgi:DNA-binding GntR family transcriptional regulator
MTPHKPVATRVREPRPVDPTERQRQFLGEIIKLAGELGRAPTATDVAERLDIGRTGARKVLMRLEELGLVSDVPKVVSSGTWKVTPLGRRFLPE